MKDWHRTHVDEQGRLSTVPARDRIQDVAFHLVYLQEAFLSVVDLHNGVNRRQDDQLERIEIALESLTARVEILETARAEGPTQHNISTPKGGWAQDEQATRRGYERRGYGSYA